ncbi:MAG: FtsX-like permease family protein, partial [bacterium]|nr:FtsX-like permease family protein [bacterium]
LLLGRSVDRRKEIAIRTALGASRLRLVRQVAAESLVLALVGGSLGVLLAVWGIQLFVSLAPNFYPPTEQIRIDGAVLKFSLMISVLTGFLFGAAPALQLSRARLGEFLKAGGRQSNKGNRQGTRRLLVVCEVGLALLLLVGAGVMVRSLIRIDGLDRGFSPEGVLSMKIWLRGPQYGMRVSSNDQRVTPLAVLFYEQLMERIANLPGVHSVGGAGTFPTQGVFRGGPFRIQGHPSPPPGEEPVAAYAVVCGECFGAHRDLLPNGRRRTAGLPRASVAAPRRYASMARQ